MLTRRRKSFWSPLALLLTTLVLGVPAPFHAAPGGVPGPNPEAPGQAKASGDERPAFKSRSADAPKKWALLVGVDDYESEDISDLRFAVADVKAVADTLVETAGFTYDTVVTMTSDATGSNRPTHLNVIKRLDMLAGRVGPKDTLLFYFSGHGYIRDEGRHFLATVNSDPTSVDTLEVSSLPLKLLQNKIAKIRAHQMLFVIDACRNDPEKGKGDADNVLTEGLSKDLVTVAKAAPASGLGGAALIFACKAGERAYEWPEKRHGVFTYYLMEALQGEGEDPTTGELTLSNIGDYVQKNVLKWCEERFPGGDKRQTPDVQTFGAAKFVLATREDLKANVAVEVDTTAKIQLVTDPPGAQIYIGEEMRKEVTPATVTVDLGRRKTKKIEVAVVRDGYEEEVRNILLERGKTLPLELELLKLPPNAPRPMRPQRIEPAPPMRQPLQPSLAADETVTLRLEEDVRSTRAANNVKLTVTSDVKDVTGKYVLIKKGAAAFGRTSRVKPPAFKGVPGELTFVIDRVTAVNGQSVPLRGEKTVRGAKRAPLALIMGGDAELKKGQVLEANVQGSPRIVIPDELVPSVTAASPEEASEPVGKKAEVPATRPDMGKPAPVNSVPPPGGVNGLAPATNLVSSETSPGAKPAGNGTGRKQKILVLKNGSRLTGTIEGRDNDSFSFLTEGKVKEIRKKEIDRIIDVETGKERKPIGKDED